jgi:putative hydrolase of the HAD superfamily
VSSPIVFDLFDTLVPGGGHAARNAEARAMAADLGVPAESFADALRSSFPERFTGALGDLHETFAALAVRCGGHPSREAVGRAVARRFAFTRSTLEPFHGVLDVLDGLLARGHRLCLLTNCTAEVPELWSALPLASRFDAAVFSCQEGIRKPSAEIYLRAAKRLDSDPDACTFVGDGASGELTGALAAGMTAIRIVGEELDHTVVGGDDFAGTSIDTLAELLDLTDHPDRLS